VAAAAVGMVNNDEWATVSAVAAACGELRLGSEVRPERSTDSGGGGVS